MATSWIPEVEELSPAALTVRAQTIDPNDPANMLLWPAFAPRRDVDSVDLSDVTTLDDRPTADRREWNQRGRHVPPRIPARREVSIVPIEAYDKIGEKEMQRLAEGSNGNEAIMQQLIGVRIPDRAMRLVMADYRRLEFDFFNAWLNGQIVQRNPQNAAETQTASFGFDSARLTTAGTAWDDPGEDAYANLIGFLEDAISAVGNIQGVATRNSVIAAIQADAPDLIGGVAMTRAQLEQRISDDVGQPFRFYMVENTVDVFTDGGTATTSTKVFTAGHLAVVPAGGQVGYTAFAPVVRAMELARQVPGAGIDIRGVTVYYDEELMGRGLTIEAQLNALPVPDEQRVFVVDTLIA